MTAQNIKLLCPSFSIILIGFRRLLLLHISQHGDGVVVKAKTGIRKVLGSNPESAFFLLVWQTVFGFYTVRLKNHTDEFILIGSLRIQTYRLLNLYCELFAANS